MSKKLNAREVKAVLKERLKQMEQKSQPLVEQPTALPATKKNGLQNVEEEDDLLRSTRELMKEIDEVHSSVFNAPPPSFSDGPTDPNIKLTSKKPKKEEPSPLEVLDKEINSAISGLDKQLNKEETASVEEAESSQPEQQSTADAGAVGQSVPESAEAQHSVLPVLPIELPDVSEAPGKEAAPVEAAAEAACYESQGDLVLPVCVVEQGESPQPEAKPSFSQGGTTMSHNVQANGAKAPSESARAAEKPFGQTGTTISSVPEGERSRRSIFGIGAEVEKLLERREAEQLDSLEQIPSSRYDEQTTPGEPQIKITPPQSESAQFQQLKPNKKPKRWKKWLAGALIAAGLLASGIGIYLSSRDRKDAPPAVISACAESPTLGGKECPFISQASICLSDTYMISTEFFCDPIKVTVDDEFSNCVPGTCTVSFPNFKWEAISLKELDKKIIDNLNYLLVQNEYLSIIPPELLLNLSIIPPELILKMPELLLKMPKLFTEGFCISLSFEEAQRYLTLPLDEPKKGIRPMYLLPRTKVIINTSSLLFTVNLNGTRGDASFANVMKEKHSGESIIGLKNISEIEHICNKTANPVSCLGGALANLTGQIKSAINNVGRLAYKGLLGNGSCDKRDITIVSPDGGHATVIGYNETEMPEAKENDCKPAPPRGGGFNLPLGMGAATGQ